MTDETLWWGSIKETNQGTIEMTCHSCGVIVEIEKEPGHVTVVEFAHEDDCYVPTASSYVTRSDKGDRPC